MKAPILIAALLLSGSAFAGDVSVSIGINEPGFYGQINIGDYPRPPLIYAEPVVIERVPAYYGAEPLYLHVPPGHEKHWRQHCAEYHACGRRVYFVEDHWYRNEYARRHERREDRRDERRDDRRDERRDERHEDHGRGHEHGRGRDDHDRGRDDRDH